MPVQNSASAIRTAGRIVSPPSGLLGMLAAPSMPRETLAAALAALPPPGMAPLLERLSYHGIDGLAHRALSRLPRGAVHPWLEAILKRRHQRCAAATLVQGMVLAEALDRFAAAGLRVAVTRGLRTVEWIYGDAGSRAVAIHELLVADADRDRAGAVLRRAGFEPAGGARFDRGGLLIDLGGAAIPVERRVARGKDATPVLDRMLGRAAPGRVAGAIALLLDPEDELHLLAIEVVRHAFDRLIRIADLAHMVAAQADAIRWEVLRERAADAGTLRVLGLALESIAWLGVAAPWDACIARPAGWLERAVIRRASADRPLPFAGDLLIALSAADVASGVRVLIDALRRPAGAKRSRSHDTVRAGRIAMFRPRIAAGGAARAAVPGEPGGARGADGR